MKQIKATEIKEETGVCPYCGNVTSFEPTYGCCGEVHAEPGYILEDDEVVLASEVEVVA